MGTRWYNLTEEEIYAYRTRKPHAVFGLPFIGRHWAYAGRSNNGARRDHEHLVGGGQYAAVAKPWADLEPRRYVIFKHKRRLRLTTHLLELLTIRILCPVYNVAHNKGNPRRIKPAQAARQRALRNQFGASARIVPSLARVGISLTILVLAWSYAAGVGVSLP